MSPLLNQVNFFMLLSKKKAIKCHDYIFFYLSVSIIERRSLVVLGIVFLEYTKIPKILVLGYSCNSFILELILEKFRKRSFSLDKSLVPWIKQSRSLNRVEASSLKILSDILCRKRSNRPIRSIIDLCTCGGLGL